MPPPTSARALGSSSRVVDRPRLSDALDSYADTPLTAVIAPAGWGKSMLLSTWAAARDGPVAWVALDSEDDDPGGLITTLYGGVAPHLEPSSAEEAGALDHLTGPAAPRRAEELATGLHSARGLVVILDDLHVLSDPVAIESIQRFVEAAPPSVRVVIASRHDPPFPIARLRVAGRLAELRQHDLAFTAEEATALVEASQLELDGPAIDALLTRTEGWGAALRLAVIAMSQSEAPQRVVEDLAGSDRIVAEYLIEEVLDDLEPATAQFLLQTSVVEQLNGALARALTASDEGTDLLERLADAGMFTSRTFEPGWYRYHYLLSGFLRMHLRSEDPDGFLELNRTAAEWLHTHGRHAAAIEHAISGDDIDRAASWLHDSVTELVTAGRAQTVADLARRLLDATPDPPLELILDRMWVLYNIGDQPEEIDQLLDVLIRAAESASEQIPSTGGDPRSMDDPLPWLVGLKARKVGDVDTLLDLDRPVNLPSPSGRVEAWIAEGALWVEDFERSEDLLLVYRSQAEQDLHAYPPSMLHALGLTAYSLASQGRLADAEEVLTRAEAMIERLRVQHLVHSLYAQLTRALVLWERGKLDAAESKLVAIQEQADRFGDVPVSAILTMARVRNRWSLGDRSGATDLLDSADILPNGVAIGGHFARRLNLERARLSVLTGDVVGLDPYLPDWSARLATQDEPRRDLLVLARLGVALDGVDEALIEKLQQPAGSLPVHRLEGLLLGAAHAHARGDDEGATTDLAEAMRISAATGMVQRLVDERESFGRIYEQAAQRSGVDDASEEGRRASLIVPLTEREMEVLELLSTHMTYRDIADHMYVSQNTIKSHAGAIYRKLAVGRRGDAVERARELGLLPT